MQQLRDQKNSTLIAILFGLIIIVFVFMFGLPSASDSCQSKDQDRLGRYADHAIGYELTRSMIFRYDGDNVFGTRAFPGRAREIVRGIAVVYMLADEARAAGLRVSDEELDDYIRNWESGNIDVLGLGFMHGNTFSKKRYDDALARIQISSRNYVSYKREELLARRYLELLWSSVSVSDAELWADYSFSNETVDIESVRLSADAVRATMRPLTDSDVEAYLISGEADVRRYYAEHIGDYSVPARAKIQQISILKDTSAVVGGAKTVKTYQPSERYSIARSKIVGVGDVDFDEAFRDYDEGADKASLGVSSLVNLDDMPTALRTVVEGRAVGDVVTAELPDRYVIAKVVESHAAEREDDFAKVDPAVRREIARKVLDESRVSAKMSQVAEGMIPLIAGGEPFDKILEQVLYADVQLEQATAEVPDETAEPLADGTYPMKTVVVPTDLPIVPATERVKVSDSTGVFTGGNYVMGIGTNEDLARDLRAATAGTMLSKQYKVASDTVLVRVVDKHAADRKEFDAQKDELRTSAINRKVLQLIGDPYAIITFQPDSYGEWLKAKIAAAEKTGKLGYNEDWFGKQEALAQTRSK